MTPLVKKVNPWLSAGVYDLPDSEWEEVYAAYDSKRSVDERCSLLQGYHAKKQERLMDGYIQGEEGHL